MSALLEMLAAAGAEGRSPRREPPPSPPDVLCTTLRETAERYAAGCPFKPGDLVTPRAASPYTGAGSPHIVLEVAEAPIRNFSEGGRETINHLFGSRLDVRVACEERGVIVAFWQESWALEPYTGQGAEPENAEAAQPARRVARRPGASPSDTKERPMSAQHTPGPWRTGIPGPTSIFAPDGDELAIVSGNFTDIETDEANARIMAAAPEMLAALKLLAADVAAYEAWQRPCHALDVAEAAIAKAEGRS